MRDVEDAPTDLIRSVSRALRLLEEVGREGRPPTAKVVARRCGLNLATTYHLLRTLCYEGYLVRQADGGYLLGPAVAARFHDLVHTLDRPPQARAVLRHLAATTGHSAYLGRLAGGQIVIADVAEGPRSPYLEDLEVGLPAAAHATAVGKALLATLPTPERRRYLAGQGLPAFTARTPTDVATVETELAARRPDGMVVEHGQFRDGVSCAATLVPAPDGTARPWALVVSARSPELAPGLLSRLRRAAADLQPTPQTS